MTTDLKPPPMTPAFRLNWRDGQARYTVDKPNIGSTDVFTPEQVAARDAQWQARVAELERDAARLDFLIAEDNCVVNQGTNGFWLCWINEHDHTRSEYQNGSYPTARAAIDAAISAREGEGAEG